MNTIIASRKKFYQEQNSSSSETSIKKINMNNIIIQKPGNEKLVAMILQIHIKKQKIPLINVKNVINTKKK